MSKSEKNKTVIEIAKLLKILKPYNYVIYKKNPTKNI